MRMLKTNNNSTKNWLILSVVNLLIVGVLGLLMRLKLIMPLTWLNQQYLLHAHSHFAFSGWVSHTLMVLVLSVFFLRQNDHLHLKFDWKQQGLVIANLFTAYGMLVAFLLQGYALYSITIATLNILVSYMFCFYVWKNALKVQGGSSNWISRSWIRAALVFLVFSSFGTFALSYLMANHNMDSRKQLAAVYFYLHFQYNGWFLFACMGLLHDWLIRKGIILKRAKTLLYVYIGACVPTYFLSVLWWDIPTWLYALVVLAALTQLVAWTFWFFELCSKLPQLREMTSKLVRYLLLVIGSAFTIKLILQALSLIPELSRYAYGFRPIIIGYLHLVLLLIISVFLLSYLFINKFLKENKVVRAAVIITVGGILLNEILLMLQGLSGMLKVYINHIPQSLTIAASIICLGLIGVLFGQVLKEKQA